MLKHYDPVKGLSTDTENNLEDKLHRTLKSFSNELLKLGVDEYIVVLAESSLSHGGMSITKTLDGSDTPIKKLRETLKEWETDNGHDPDEDWSKE